MQKTDFSLILIFFCHLNITGEDSCSGDSGGPLFSRKGTDFKETKYLVGIVSFGTKKCGTVSNFNTIPNQRKKKWVGSMISQLKGYYVKYKHSWNPNRPPQRVLDHCTVVEGVDKTYLANFEYWFKFGLFGQFWIYFDGIQALNYFWMMIYEFLRGPKTQKLTISDDFW